MCLVPSNAIHGYTRETQLVKFYSKFHKSRMKISFSLLKIDTKCVHINVTNMKAEIYFLRCYNWNIFTFTNVIVQKHLNLLGLISTINHFILLQSYRWCIFNPCWTCIDNWKIQVVPPNFHCGWEIMKNETYLCTSYHQNYWTKQLHNCNPKWVSWLEY